MRPFGAPVSALVLVLVLVPASVLVPVQVQAQSAQREPERVTSETREDDVSREKQRGRVWCESSVISAGINVMSLSSIE